MLHTQVIIHGRTVTLPTIGPGDPPASLTDHLATGPVLLVLSCRDDDGGAVLAISRRGLHQELGPVRVIQSVDYVVERALGLGETYERPLQTAAGAGTLRLRHQAGPRQGSAHPGDAAR